jgi:hypothetical protein
LAFISQKGFVMSDRKWLLRLACDRLAAPMDNRPKKATERSQSEDFDDNFDLFSAVHMCYASELGEVPPNRPD